MAHRNRQGTILLLVVVLGAILSVWLVSLLIVGRVRSTEIGRVAQADASVFLRNWIAVGMDCAKTKAVVGSCAVGNLVELRRSSNASLVASTGATLVGSAQVRVKCRANTPLTFLVEAKLASQKDWFPVYNISHAPTCP